MAVRIGGQEPGDLGPPFRRRQVRQNSGQGFRNAAPYDSRSGNDSPLWPEVLVKICKLDEAIAAGESGVVTVWRNPRKGSEPKETNEKLRVYLDWTHGEKGLPAGIEAWIFAFEDENLWRFLPLDNRPTMVKLMEDLLPGSTAAAMLGSIDHDGCFVETVEILVEDIFCYAVACTDDMLPVYAAYADPVPPEEQTDPPADPLPTRFFPFEPRQIDGMCAEVTEMISAGGGTGSANLMLCCDEIAITIRNDGDDALMDGDHVTINLHRCPPETTESCEWTCEWVVCPRESSGGGGSGGDCCCQKCLPFGCLQFTNTAFDLGVPRCFGVECCCDCEDGEICITRTFCEDNGLFGKTHYFEWTYTCDAVEVDSGTFEIDLHCMDTECVVQTIPVCGGVDVTIGNDVGCFCNCQVNLESIVICDGELPENATITVTGACKRYRAVDPDQPYLDVCYEVCYDCEGVQQCYERTVEMECNDECLSPVLPVDPCSIMDP